MGRRGQRRRSRLRPIAEAVAYAHYHGDRGPDLVRVVKLEPRRPRHFFPASGETLRRAFESRLDTRNNQTAARRLLKARGAATEELQD
jgi:hypothetical protein